MERTASTVTEARTLIEQLEGYVAMQEDQKRQIGERIRTLRNDSRHTNDSIAREVGVSSRAVAKWMEGRGISRDSAEKVAEVFDVDPDWLWSGKETAPAGSPLDALSPAASTTQVAEILDRLDWIESALTALALGIGVQLDARESGSNPQHRSGS